MTAQCRRALHPRRCGGADGGAQGVEVIGRAGQDALIQPHSFALVACIHVHARQRAKHQRIVWHGCQQRTHGFISQRQLAALPDLARDLYEKVSRALEQ